ncbi:unnamed protein product [Absidia cylindrospora]
MAIHSYSQRTISGTNLRFVNVENLYRMDDDNTPYIREDPKFGKVKPHRGHEVEGVEKTRQRKVFLTTVVDRGANTMKEVITRFVLPGSIIRTDFWRSYDRIEEWTDDQGMSLDYVHQKVNHSQENVTVNSVHTKTTTIGSVFICRNEKYY